MRQYLFRGKSTSTGEWLHGMVWNFRSGTTWIVPDNVGFRVDADKATVDRRTVGQYVGLADARGVDIYEGDILDDGTGELMYEVTFGEYAYTLKGRGTGLPLRDYYVRQLTVVGNIHDTKH